MDGEGDSIGSYTVTDVNAENAKLSVPVASVIVKDKTAESFTIEYSCNALEEATGYKLGADFDPGTVTLKVHLDQMQSDSAKDPEDEDSSYTEQIVKNQK